MDTEQLSHKNSKSLLKLLVVFSKIMKLKPFLISTMQTAMESLTMKNSLVSSPERVVAITLTLTQSLGPPENLPTK